MTRLLKKEFALAMHPITPVMLLLAAMVVIPNYPYVVIFFYISMAVFFTCLLGRENNDIVYSLNLPVSKSDIVKARFGFTVIVELLQLALMIPFALLNRQLIPDGNQAGMDANIALFGLGLMIYGLFNLIFFVSYYRNVDKVGVAFIKTSVLIFIVAGLDVFSTYAIPFVRDCLDTPDPEFLSAKLLFLAAGIIVFIALTALSRRISIRSFERLDLH
ncbi:MAG: ABC-2 transporter permease [Bacillota bacterium]|nr:ABC-2 transporter permease [Bacillota bacterium]